MSEAKRCKYFRKPGVGTDLDWKSGCTCNNEPDDIGECVYGDGISHGNPICKHYDGDSKGVIWAKYLCYLQVWSEYHRASEFYGMTPACFDDWYLNEYQDEDAEMILFFVEYTNGDSSCHQGTRVPTIEEARILCKKMINSNSEWSDVAYVGEVDRKQAEGFWDLSRLQDADWPVFQPYEKTRRKPI